MEEHIALKMVRKGNGNIVVPSELPRFVYVAGVITSICAAFYLLVPATSGPGASMSHWLGFGALLAAAWLAWQAVSVADVEFDAARHCVLHGGDRPIRFSEIAQVEISVRARSDQEQRGDQFGPSHAYTYTVELRMNDRRTLRLGRSVDQLDASEAAATIARLVDKSVQKV